MTVVRVDDLLLKLLHPPGLTGAHTGDVTVDHVSLLHPHPHRLDPIAELRSHPIHRPVVGPQLGPQGPHHPDRGSLLPR